MLFSFSADVLGSADGFSEETSSGTGSSLLTSMFSTIGIKAEKHSLRRFVFVKTAAFLSFDSWEIFLF